MTHDLPSSPPQAVEQLLADADDPHRAAAATCDIKRLSRQRAKPFSGSGFKSLPRKVTTNGNRVARTQRKPWPCHIARGRLRGGNRVFRPATGAIRGVLLSAPCGSAGGTCARRRRPSSSDSICRSMKIIAALIVGLGETHNTRSGRVCPAISCSGCRRSWDRSACRSRERGPIFAASVPATRACKRFGK